MAIAKELMGRPTKPEAGMLINEEDAAGLFELLIKRAENGALSRMQKGLKGKLSRMFSTEGIRLFSFNKRQGLIDADELPAGYRVDDPVAIQRIAFKIMGNHGYREENCKVIVDGFENASDGAYSSYDLRRYPAGNICFERETFLEGGGVTLVNWRVRDASASRSKAVV